MYAHGVYDSRAAYFLVALREILRFQQISNPPLCKYTLYTIYTHRINYFCTLSYLVKYVNNVSPAKI